jgi:hypothetical protein
MQMHMLLSALLATLISLIGFAPASASERSPAIPDQAALRINEFMAENASGLENPDQPGAFPDWLELYNPSAEEVSLDGLFLTDDAAKPTRYAIPNGLRVPAGGFLLFYADSQPELGPQHTNFGLKKDGEYLGLYAAQGSVVIDGYNFGPQVADVSSARSPDGGESWTTTVCATPGASNAPCAVQYYLPVVLD